MTAASKHPEPHGNGATNQQALPDGPMSAESGSSEQMRTVREGVMVRCWPGVRPGNSFITVALSDPFHLGGPEGTEVIRVRRVDRDSHHDCIAMTHVEAVVRREHR